MGRNAAARSGTLGPAARSFSRAYPPWRRLVSVFLECLQVDTELSSFWRVPFHVSLYEFKSRLRRNKCTKTVILLHSLISTSGSPAVSAFIQARQSSQERYMPPRAAFSSRSTMGKVE